MPAVRVGGPPPTFLARHPALVATSYDGKEEIYGESDPAEYVYQVIRGAVRTYKLLNDGRRQIGAFHLPGDVFGLESGVEHRLTAEAIIETTVRVVKRRALEAVAKTDVRIACEFWTLTSGNLRHAEDHMLLLGPRLPPSGSPPSCSKWIAGCLSRACSPSPCAGVTSPIILGLI